MYNKILSIRAKINKYILLSKFITLFKNIYKTIIVYYAFFVLYGVSHFYNALIKNCN